MLKEIMNKNLYLLAYTDTANDVALTLKQKGFADAEEVINFLEANGWIDITDIYAPLLQEDCYVYSKFENDYLRVAIYEGVYEDGNEGKINR